MPPFKVTVLADTGVRRRPRRGRCAGSQAPRRNVLANQKADIDLAKAQVELAEAVAQLRAIERLRKMR